MTDEVPPANFGNFENPPSMNTIGAQPQKKSSRLALIIGIVVLAVILIAGLVIKFLVLDPAAERTEAVNAFQDATSACETANSDFAAALSEAATAIETDPETLTNEALIGDLEEAIADAKSVTPCESPKMAGTTKEITQQTEDMNTATQKVTDSITALTQATEAITANQEEKKAAKEKARKEAAAKMQTGCAPIVTDEGYKIDLTWKGLGLNVDNDSTEGEPGNSLITVHTFMGSATATNRTPGKKIEFTGNVVKLLMVNLIPVYDTNICDITSNYVEETYYDDEKCSAVELGGKQYYTSILFAGKQNQRDIGASIMATGPFDVDEEITYDNEYGTDEGYKVQVSNDIADELAETLAEPAGWLAVIDKNPLASGVMVGDRKPFTPRCHSFIPDGYYDYCLVGASSNLSLG